MSATIIKPRERISIKDYYVEFSDDDGSGWLFEADEEGQLLHPYWPSLNEAIDLFCDDKLTIKMFVSPRTYTEPAEAVCPCGAHMWLEGRWDGDGCDNCGRLFNLSGQELAPKHMWEERENDDDFHTIAEYAHAYDD